MPPSCCGVEWGRYRSGHFMGLHSGQGLYPRSLASLTDIEVS